MATLIELRLQTHEAKISNLSPKERTILYERGIEEKRAVSEGRTSHAQQENIYALREHIAHRDTQALVDIRAELLTMTE